tara:strand:- start:124 stop:699 length:576 start_codon:yes stop_codon:yes gene_type:complete
MKTKKFCKKHNYQHKLWNLIECVNLIEEHYPQYMSLWRSFRFDIQRADFIRYLILHKYGGMYIDCDVSPAKCLDTLLEGDVIFTKWSNDKKSLPYNAVMGTVPNSPLFAKIAQEVEKSTIRCQSMPIYNTWKGRLVFQTTGHYMLKRVVPASNVLDLLWVVNPDKKIDVCSPDYYFHDSNASIWYKDFTKK